MGTSYWFTGSYPTIQCTTFHWLLVSKAAGWCLNKTCDDWCSHMGTFPQWVVMSVRFFLSLKRFQTLVTM